MIKLILLTMLLAMTIHAQGKENMFMTEIPIEFSPPVPENDYDKQLHSQIDELGWHNVHIAEENGMPAFAFTLGHFHKQNHPELIIIGLPAETAHELLNIAVVKIVGAKEAIEPYKKYNDFTESLSVAFVPVDLEHYGEYLGYANWYYGSMPKPFPVMQMVWPDREGKYPWEPGYDKSFLQIQPILGAMP